MRRCSQGCCPGYYFAEVFGIKPEVVDPEDIEMLQDLVMAAINEALRKAQEKSENNMRSITGGMSGGIPGIL